MGSTVVSSSLSILITFYEQDFYLEDVVKSCIEAFSKSNFSYEILLCIQDPSDYAMRFIAEISDKYANIHCFAVSTDNDVIPLSLAGRNRYFLLSKANSKYCLFLDGDDVYTSNVDDGIEYLDSNCDVKGVVYKYITFNRSTMELVSCESVYKDRERITVDTHRAYVHASSILFRRDALLGNIPALYCNDTTITRTLLSRGDLVYFDRVLLRYSIGIKSIYSGGSFFDRKMSEFIVNEVNVRLFPEKRKSFLRKLSRMAKINSGALGNLLMKECWDRQVNADGLFLSKLMLSAFREKNGIFRVCILTLIKVKIFLMLMR